MPTKKETLTDEERSRRIQETAEQLGTDESPEAFDKAFKKVISSSLASANRKEKTAP